MKTKKTLIPVLFVVSLLLCCSDGCTLYDNNVGADFSQLKGSTYVLSVNRISEQPDVQFPSEALQEDDYVESTQDVQYNISFSDDIQTVTIMSENLISGVIETDDEILKKYALTSGLFAGGRFAVWIADTQFEAELTIYGSGIPIIKSERGVLVLSQ